MMMPADETPAMRINTLNRSDKFHGRLPVQISPFDVVKIIVRGRVISSESLGSHIALFLRTEAAHDDQMLFLNCCT